jgi:hypothetical protein
MKKTIEPALANPNSHHFRMTGKAANAKPEGTDFNAAFPPIKSVERDGDTVIATINTRKLGFWHSPQFYLDEFQKSYPQCRYDQPINNFTDVESGTIKIIFSETSADDFERDHAGYEAIKIQARNTARSLS